MLWLKAFHIIFVVCWFAGLFYLPRIFVYYAASEHDETRAQLAVMARKLYRFVTPFMVLAIGFGLAMMWMNPQYYLAATWLWIKLGGVAFLVVYHFQCGRYVTQINNDRNRHGHVFYRFFNEVPVLFLFAIVILAVLKPF
ncbi:protoporphyrinogen oxidase HemJ [Parahalioglobus pacificus]|uniref:Protoporphyrinogen IX oxidase n=1 Tax=Parahalioglobus pacificus TaxID=930806 RepID=A0A919CKI6_9GAMM|nr:protoporphyrinogen oxidase HemJ [Halioglobus pacificus]NQY03622.1 protoporphyrinogen oxidase HemJ [Halieaceae bacterium]GHD33412.1 TIGR00701 family protein [Halioglobus pacificus]